MNLENPDNKKYNWRLYQMVAEVYEEVNETFEVNTDDEVNDIEYSTAYKKEI